MSKQVEFLFDVGSPYSYLAYKQLPKIAAAQGAQIRWTPVLLGGIFQATGNHSPAEVPAKGLHSNIDLQRWARHFGVTFGMNPNFPINTLQLMRGAVGMQMRSETEFHTYLDAVFAAMFGKPQNMGSPEVVASVLADAGIDPALFLTLVNDTAVKEMLKKNTTEAVQRGAFGAPTFFVNGDMYWGQDRLHFVEAALS
ncbi:MAG: 2-hydroxychromene-2-carboxylate isomerase [Burkholderiales bacterium]|nr:2-hydroxychromene-2-carboxylate isomerase [Burkholderiales bacterium]